MDYISFIIVIDAALRILWAFINSKRYLDCTFRASVALFIYRNYVFTFSKQRAASFGSLWANLVSNTLIGEKEELAFCISVTFLKTFFHSKIRCGATNHILTTTRLFHIYQVVFKFLTFWRSWVANSSYNCCLDMKISYLSLNFHCFSSFNRFIFSYSLLFIRLDRLFPANWPQAPAIKTYNKF